MRVAQGGHNIHGHDRVVYNQQSEDAREFRHWQQLPDRRLQLDQLRQQLVHWFLEPDDEKNRLGDEHGTGEHDAYYVEVHGDHDANCGYCDFGVGAGGCCEVLGAHCEKKAGGDCALPGGMGTMVWTIPCIAGIDSLLVGFHEPSGGYEKIVVEMVPLPRAELVYVRVESVPEVPTLVLQFQKLCHCEKSYDASSMETRSENNPKFQIFKSTKKVYLLKSELVANWHQTFVK